MTLMRMPKIPAGRGTDVQATGDDAVPEAAGVARDARARGDWLDKHWLDKHWLGRHWLGKHWLGGHWLIAVLLLAGLVLRVLAMVAYRPILFYIDSTKYLEHAGGNDPVGYRVPLRLILLVANLDTVAAVQHLLGLAMAVVLYAVLVRRGCRGGWPRWPRRRFCSTPTSCRSSRRSCLTCGSRR